jgi:hypothetical protein
MHSFHRSYLTLEQNRRITSRISHSSDTNIWIDLGNLPHHRPSWFTLSFGGYKDCPKQPSCWLFEFRQLLKNLWNKNISISEHLTFSSEPQSLTAAVAVRKESAKTCIWHHPYSAFCPLPAKLLMNPLTDSTLQTTTYSSSVKSSLIRISPVIINGIYVPFSN